MELAIAVGITLGTIWLLVVSPSFRIAFAIFAVICVAFYGWLHMNAQERARQSAVYWQQQAALEQQKQAEQAAIETQRQAAIVAVRENAIAQCEHDSACYTATWVEGGKELEWTRGTPHTAINDCCTGHVPAAVRDAQFDAAEHPDAKAKCDRDPKCKRFINGLFGRN